MKKLLALLMLAAVLLCTSSCGSNMLKSARPIEDVHQLDGQRVGVALGWGADYLLTHRKDMTLMRYDTFAEMVLALSYRRIDAVALDQPMAPQLLSCVEGLRMVEEPVAHDGLVCYVLNSREDLLQAFNAFAAEFRHTPEYADLYARFSSPDGYTPRYVEPTGTGPVLRVGVVEDSMPFSYIDFSTGACIGSDVEYITHFANACGYTLEWVPGSYEAVELGVAYGEMDMGVGGMSDLYRADLQASGRALVTDIYMPMDIVFIEIADPDQLRVVTTIDY